MQDVHVTLPPGSIVRDRYVIEDLLGKGGFGAVYLVRDLRVKRNLFALKEVIDPNRKERSRFLFESDLLKRLDHRALPRVYRVFEDDTDDRIYMLMDYVEGPNLEKLRQQQPGNRFSLPQVLTIMTPIIDAVTYLHGQQPPILHRDIKPSNIIMPTTGDGTVLVDLGIAKEYNPDSTTTAIRRCSPGYAALEQYRKGTSIRTDIYALGATIYNLLTGTIPADALHRMIQLDSEGTDPLEPVDKLVSDVPQAVAEAISRAMALNSNDRFATVEQFWQTLDADTTWGRLATPAIAAANPPPLVPSIPPPTLTPPGVTPAPIAPQQPVVSPAPVTVSIKKQRQVSHFRAPAVLLLILLALLIGLGIGTGLWSSLVSMISSRTTHSSAPVPASQITATTAASPTLIPTARPTVKPTAVSSTPTSPPVVVPIADPTAMPTPQPTSPPAPTRVPSPNVAGNYSGTIDNTTANIITSMALSIQEELAEGEISGHFTVGAPLVGSGPFTGTVATNNHIQFTVPRHKNIAPLFFYGWIQADGSIKGDYCSLNEYNECDPAAGAGGTWYVIPSSSGS